LPWHIPSLTDNEFEAGKEASQSTALSKAVNVSTHYDYTRERFKRCDIGALEPLF
jgi:hypothetical protein